MATMSDVAKLAQVSISTVSRALSEKVYVDTETKKKVLRAIELLQYHPNVLAQGLKGVGTKTIALVIPNICNPSFPKAARGAEDAARRRGYIVITCNTDEDLDLERMYVDHLRTRYIDGLIFATVTESSRHIPKMRNEGFPVIQLMRYQENDVNSVHIDNFKAGYAVADHLIRGGCRRIAVLQGDTAMAHLNRRFAGYRKALEDHGLRFDQNLSEPLQMGDDNGLIATQRLIDKDVPFDGLICMNDSAALGGMQVLKSKGLRIPQDVAVIGIDNLDFTPFLDPMLTTLEQPLYEMGYTACELLMDIIEEKAPNHGITKILDARLIERASTRPVR